MRPALYRVYQFFVALKAYLPLWVGGARGTLTDEDATFVEAILVTPRQQQLFKRMSPNDQRHGIAVARSLERAGYYQPALMQAALLHDVGKSINQPILHRVLIVLFENFWPVALRWLSQGGNFVVSQPLSLTAEIVEQRIRSISQWRQPFFVHAHHPTIGAIWAREARCNPLAITLILNHQDKRGCETSDALQQEMLAILQWADNLN